MTTAFVLWGGGSLGAAQVGMLRALTARGIQADVVVGASSGAINGVCYAARPDPEGVEELAQHWLQVGRHDVFPLTLTDSLRVLAEDLPVRPLHGVLRALGAANHAFPFSPITLAAAMMGRCNHLIDSARFEQFMHRVLPVEDLEQTRVPVEVLTTDLRTGESVPLTRGPAVPAVVASAAIPAVYPAVEYDGHTLVDGEVANGTSLDHAVDLGADEIYVLAPTASYRLAQPPTNVLAMAVQTYNLLSEQRIAASIEQARHRVRLHRLPSPNTADVVPIDFSQTAELIDEATAATTAWLEAAESTSARRDAYALSTDGSASASPASMQPGGP